MLYVIPLCSYVCSQAMSLFAEKKNDLVARVFIYLYQALLYSEALRIFFFLSLHQILFQA